MDSLGLYDIYDYYHQPFWQTTLFMVACGVLSLCVIIAAVWWCMRVLEARKGRNYWLLWHKNLELLRTKKVADRTFYVTLTHLIKECAVIKLSVKESLTDLELALLLKSGDFPEAVRGLGELLERAAVYKFDPVHAVPVDQKKELERVYDALQVLKQREETKTP